MAVTVKYGMGNSVVLNLAGRTVRAIRTDRNIQSVLGYTDNVDAMIDCVAVDDSTIIRDGNTISFSTRASSKA